MAKKNMADSTYMKEARQKRIDTCLQCNGAPPIKESNLQGLIFKHCELCLEVVGDWHKEGSAIKVTTKNSVKLSHTDPSKKRESIEILTIIPGTDFSELEIR